MLIETHRGLFAAPATVEDVAPAVATLTDPGQAFVVVEHYPKFPESHDDDYDECYYIQAAGSIQEDGFLVEYRDGGPGDHFRADRRVAANELVTLLKRYVNGDEDWRSTLTWHRVNVDKPRVVN